MSATTDETLLTVVEAAQFLRVSRSWVYQAAQRGELPAFHVGRTVRFTRSTLQAWVEKQKTTAPAVATLGRG